MPPPLSTPAGAHEDTVKSNYPAYRGVGLGLRSSNHRVTHLDSCLSWHTACFPVRRPRKICRRAVGPEQNRCETLSQDLHRSPLNTASIHSRLTTGHWLSIIHITHHHTLYPLTRPQAGFFIWTDGLHFFLVFRLRRKQLKMDFSAKRFVGS